MGDFFNKLKAFDAYPKINEDFFSRTATGGVITLVSSAVMFLLFLSEFRLFLTVQESDVLTVDTSRGEKLAINLDITFPKLPCEWVSLDVMDISGDVQLEVDHDVYKKRIDQYGNIVSEVQRGKIGPEKKNTDGTDECGSCYGAGEEGECCNTCEDVRKVYRRKGWALTNPDTVEQCIKEGYIEKLLQQEGEGCHVYGFLMVNKVAGNFHFAPGRSFQSGGQHVHDMSPFKDKHLDFTHVISKLSFGSEYPGMVNPLDNTKRNHVSGDNPMGQDGMYQYFLKVVPTTFTDIRNNSIITNQFSVTEHFKVLEKVTSTSIPGVFFFYDLSPIKVQKKESRVAFIEFITSACAIIGGVFTVSGIIDALIYQGQKAIKHKMDLGKFN